MKNNMVKIVCLFIFVFLYSSTTYAKSISVSKQELSSEIFKALNLKSNGDLQYLVKYTDTLGEHLLLLTKASLQSNRTSSKIDTYKLFAASYIKSGKKFRQEWSLNDSVICPDLDSSADFYLEQVTITDANNDGTAEVYIPYSKFCGGGIDPKTIKIIMRSGNKKFALRGESKIVIKGQDPYGGDKTIDKEIDKPEYKTFKDEILKIWDLIYIHN